MRYQGVTVLTALTVILSLPAQAAINTYSSRSGFLAAAGAVQVETFNVIGTDQSFHASALQVGSATFQGYGANPVGFNYIDVSPFVIPAVTIDGSPFLLGAVSTGSGFSITYQTPITAWGADFVDLQNQVVRTSVEFVGAGTVVPVVNPNNQQQTFFGITSSTPFTVVRFDSINATYADGIAIDNITTSVPEPSAALLLVCGLLSLPVLRCGAAVCLGGGLS